MTVSETRADQQHALGPGGAWAMAVGGMIGGGIFSTLGVVITVAGQWTWFSFLLGGLVWAIRSWWTVQNEAPDFALRTAPEAPRQ